MVFDYSTSALIPFTVTSSSAPIQPSFVVTTDFNGDGKLDWAGLGDSGVIVYLGDGTGAFTAAPGSPFAIAGAPFAIAVGDFNGDGEPDLAVDTDPRS